MKFQRICLNSFFAIWFGNFAHAATSTQKIVESHFRPLVDVNQPKERRYQSILVGVVTPSGVELIPLGTLTDQGAIAQQNTLFEIGSITKAFLGILMAQESLNGTLNLDEAFNSSAHVKLPSFQKNEITWRHLAQHTAGLPAVPTNLPVTLQPYENYDIHLLQKFLAFFQLSAIPGVSSQYSNIGPGLVGHQLEQVHKKSFEQILRDSFLDRLGLSDTRIDLTAEQTSRLAPVFLNGDPSEVWRWKDTSVLRAAGALRSSAQDLTRFLSTLLGFGDQELLPAIELATTPTFQKSANLGIGLFWHHFTQEGIVWHTGGTFGSTSFLGYDPDHLVGLVVLANSALIDERGADARLLNASVKVVQDLALATQMESPVLAVRGYDSEVSRRISAFEKTPANASNKNWVKLKIEHMFDLDQYVRDLWMNPPSLTAQEKNFFRLTLLRRFYLRDWKNTEELKKLLKLHGWFKISEWGAETDRRAWFLVQHADHDIEFQKQVLQTLSTLYPLKETSPKNYAYLYDRVAVSHKNPATSKAQRYGTQGRCTGPRKWEPHPIEDKINLDARRTKMGLEPMQEYIQLMQAVCN